ncbi:hypothetical protein HMPREF1577_00296 [Gardnerella pickettii JCP8017A]|uniref:Uncharacterized protein n=1 Tax=Gardnerella pickettii JCP8017A TaxID=1261062 RepID=T2PP71_9BIFI|nr:hypothetical protein HMPREF1577_00296 [Gardnerella pickettii JCP8017A]
MGSTCIKLCLFFTIWGSEENCRKWQKSSPAFIRCVLLVTFS